MELQFNDEIHFVPERRTNSAKLPDFSIIDYPCRGVCLTHNDGRH
jgi:hypothetical protein